MKVITCRTQLEAATARQAETAAGAEAADATRSTELCASQSRISQLEVDLAARMEEVVGLQARLTEAQASQQQLTADLSSVKEALGASHAKVAGLEAAVAHGAKVWLKHSCGLPWC